MTLKSVIYRVSFRRTVNFDPSMNVDLQVTLSLRIEVLTNVTKVLQDSPVDWNRSY